MACIALREKSKIERKKKLSAQLIDFKALLLAFSDSLESIDLSLSFHKRRSTTKLKKRTLFVGRRGIVALLHEGDVSKMQDSGDDGEHSCLLIRRQAHRVHSFLEIGKER